MSTSIDTSVLDKINNTSTGSTSKAATDEAGSADRFLKLLVTQMQNQDPMNPMDNAQLTSQIAQINTVSGIATLNTTVEGLSGQFLQMQTMQGASLVGKDVVVEGNKLTVDGTGTAKGGFELGAAADSVKVSVLSGSGQVLDTIDMGAQGSGTHTFAWPAGTNTTSGLTFKVTATSGASSLSPTLLMTDTVNSVSSNGKELMLDLQKAGEVAYSKVKAQG